MTHDPAAGYRAALAARYHSTATPRPPGTIMTNDRYLVRGRPVPSTPCPCRGAGLHCRNRNSQEVRRQRERQEQQPAPTAAPRAEQS